MTPYYKRQHEMSVESDCISWGSRVILPTSLRKSILNELHECNPGIIRMKNFARNYLCLPYLDSDIESVVNGYATCQHKLKSPSEAPLHPCEWPNEHWRRLHIDNAGPIQNQMMLIIVDYHNKWIDIHVATSSNASVTIEKLMSYFVTHGLPHTIVSDNGSYFVSSEFELFNKMNGIRHIKVSHRHPASTGLAERAVQTVKSGISKLEGGTNNRKERVSYQDITPQTITEISLSQLLMKSSDHDRIC